MSDQKPYQPVGPISDDHQPKRGWKVVLNGELVEKVTSLSISNPKIGMVSYGLAPAGYDVWAFAENGGGGSVILPYAIIDGSLVIGTLEQNRPHQGGLVRNVPRGFLQEGKSHFETAQSEFAEETGYGKPFDIQPLPGAPQNPNSTFFVNAGEGEGVKFYAVRIPAECLEVVDGPERYRFKPGMVKTDAASIAAKLAEQILGAVFLTWSEVVRLGDMFSSSGAARLVAYLEPKRQL